MGQMIFDFLQWLINSIFNIIFTPIFGLIANLFPGFDEVLSTLNNIFNEYIWDLYNFIPAFLKSALHIPNTIFVIIADLITAGITAYLTYKAVLLFKNIWGMFHGNFNNSSDGSN